MKLTSEEVNDIALESRLLLTEQELAGAVRYINNFQRVRLAERRAFQFCRSLRMPIERR